MRPARALLAVLLVLLSAAAPAADPQRNLLVELRQTDEASLARSHAGADGAGVVVDAAGGVRGGVAIGSVARSRDATADGVQQVRVLNGGRAGVRLARAVPLEFLQVVWTPQGVQAVPSTQWSETARGFVVRPRWPGGAAPATVEILAETGGADPNERGELLTTVQLPLGAWVTIASSGGASSTRQRGSFSTRDVDASRRQVVQLRVTAP